MVYNISAGAILYALIKSGHQKIYGVVGALPVITQDNWHSFAQQAELEMMTQGLGDMDFDGNFSVDPGLLSLIGACSDCTMVLSCAKRRNKAVRTVTAYLMEQQTAILIQTGDVDYALCSDADPAQTIADFLGLPETNRGLSDLQVDSGFVLDKDREGLISNGCSEEMADLIIGACRGVDGYAQISPVVNDAQTDLVTLYFNDNGILSVDVAYTWGQELFCLTTVTPQWVADHIRQMQNRG